MIHKYKMNGLNIVLDINSGAVHLMDEISYDLLGEEGLLDIYDFKLTKYEEEDLIEAKDQLEDLKDQGLLYYDEDYSYIKDKVYEPGLVKALCLNVAHDCNLKCSYCFAKQGNFGGKPQLMPLEVGKRSLDFLIENSGKRKNLEVDFFGGEPLMNWQVVKELVSYGNKRAQEEGKNFRFTITTNGVLLNDEIIDFINENMSNVVLSLDGRREINDKNRPTVNDRGSYDIIVPKFQKLVKERDYKDYYIRGTFTRDNLDFKKDAEHFKDLGFNITSIEPVVDSDPNNSYAIKEEDLDQILEEYEDFATEYSDWQEKGEDYKFFHFMIDLSQGPCVIKRIRGCGAGTEYLSITPEGDIYPCHQFVGEEDFILGNVMDQDLELDYGVRSNFEDLNIFTKETCKSCWAKFYCSGGCHANAWHFNQDFKKPYEMGCQMERKRIECAIMIEAERAIRAREKDEIPLT